MSFDQLLIHYSAPTLCAIKPANLFSVKEDSFFCETFRSWKSSISSQGLTATTVRRKNGIVLVLVYNASWLKRIISDLNVKKYLLQKEYHETECEGFIRELLHRIENKESFPHEVGIALGYPVEDVIAFESCEGKNCKYCGSWKCYSDVKKAQACESMYKNCSALCSKWFDEGCSLHQIIKKYKEAALAA